MAIITYDDEDSEVSIFNSSKKINIPSSDLKKEEAEEIIKQELDSLLQKRQELLVDFMTEGYKKLIAQVGNYLPSEVAKNIYEKMPQDLSVQVQKIASEISQDENDFVKYVLKETEGEVRKTGRRIRDKTKIFLSNELMNHVEENTKSDPVLAEQIQKSLFVFEDIVYQSDIAVQRILREIDVRTLALALRNSDQEVQNKIFRNLSEGAGNILKEEMTFWSVVFKRDSAEAQNKIIQVIKRLEEQGELRIYKPDDDFDFL